MFFSLANHISYAFGTGKVTLKSNAYAIEIHTANNGNMLKKYRVEFNYV